MGEVYPLARARYVTDSLGNGASTGFCNPNGTRLHEVERLAQNGLFRAAPFVTAGGNAWGDHARCARRCRPSSRTPDALRARVEPILPRYDPLKPRGPKR